MSATSAEQVDRFLELTRTQQEFFMSLLPSWHFAVTELIEATIALCD
jgi:hypothetical protein